MNQVDCSFTRRSFLQVGAMGGLALVANQLLLPDIAMAEEMQLPAGEVVQSEVVLLTTSDLTEGELAALHDQAMADEVDRVIAEAMEKDAQMGYKASSRPTYSTTYGAKGDKWTPWKDVAGQPKNGTNISSGGSIFVKEGGGGTVSCSWSFGAPYGSLGVSYEIGKVVSTGGYNINISSKGYYVAQQRKLYKCQPYVVYVTKNGKKSVYKRALIATYGERQGFRAVKR